jgi:hypothetical protein
MIVSEQSNSYKQATKHHTLACIGPGYYEPDSSHVNQAEFIRVPNRPRGWTGIVFHLHPLNKSLSIPGFSLQSLRLSSDFLSCSSLGATNSSSCVVVHPLGLTASLSFMPLMATASAWNNEQASSSLYLSRTRAFDHLPPSASQVLQVESIAAILTLQARHLVYLGRPRSTPSFFCISRVAITKQMVFWVVAFVVCLCCIKISHVFHNKFRYFSRWSLTLLQ